MTDGDELPSDELIGQVIADRYRIDEKLGEGGMGAVYRGEHVLMRKTVAVKILHREMMVMDEVVRRFEREAIAAGRIHHVNVVSATDFGKLADGSCYLVLEYVSGRCLVDVLKEAPLPVERAVAITRQIAEALQAAHSEGIVHRDLKPDNVMLVEQANGDEQVKVLDFGIAKLKMPEDTKLTQMGSVFGTPQYMAPEQAAGNEVDHRVDLYALGLMLHEMLSGKPTFQHDQVVALLAKHMTEEPPPLPDSVPEHLRDLVSALLRKSAEQRPQTATDVLAWLDAPPSSMATVPAPAMTVDTPAPGTAADIKQRAQSTLRAALAVAKHHWQRAAPIVRRVTPVLRRAAITAHDTRVKGVPVWAFGAGAVVLIGLLVAVGGNDEAPVKQADGEAKAPAAAQSNPAQAAAEGGKKRKSTVDDPELARIISLAKNGSKPAIYALEQRDEDERSADEWLGLAIGRLRAGKIEEALEAAEEAIDEEPRLAGDETLLGALRYFSEKEGSEKPVLEFVAEHLGSHGADLLFHVWSSTSRKTTATQLAKELLDSGDVQDEMSEGLKLALELREAKSCEERKKLMPRLEQSGDERSMVPMREMAKTNGCGPRKKDDCFPCLREDDAFKNALTQVAMRNAPRYEWRR